MVEAIRPGEGMVEILDQRRLPAETVFLQCRTYDEVARAIRDMAVRGAPAIGVAAGFGLVLAAEAHAADDRETFMAALDRAAEVLRLTRPTAVNLSWALDRMLGVAASHRELPVPELVDLLRREAAAILAEDVEMNRRMGRHGCRLIRDGDTVLTHCNAGALATGGYGTALGVIRAAWAEGKRVRVFVDETRPLLQGARLTAWELVQEGIPAILITDSMAGHFMRQGRVNIVIVGADRIAANGDVANKIGTYTLAVLAGEHRIPFYVAAPSSTVDMSVPTGDDIVIEERDASEVTHVSGQPVAPAGVLVANPAFDITPHRYVTAIVTDRGVIYPPYARNLAAVFGDRAHRGTAGGTAGGKGAGTHAGHEGDS